jgi:hypothetical protein
VDDFFTKPYEPVASESAATDIDEAAPRERGKKAARVAALLGGTKR